MKRRYEMVENIVHDENNRCINGEHMNQSDEEHKSQKNNKNNNTSGLVGKKTKLMDYIKESFRSIKRWFDGGDEKRDTANIKQSSSLLVRENNNQPHHENIKSMDYSFAIKPTAYKIKAFKDINEALPPLEHMVHLIPLTKQCIDEMNSKTSINKKPIRNTWGSNSFLLKSSRLLTPRVYDFSTTTKTITSLNNDNVTKKYEKLDVPLNSSSCATTHVNDIKPILSSTINRTQSNSGSVLSKNARQSRLEHSKDYFNMKITALQALTSKEYHEDEKKFIIEQIKKHQKKRSQLKTQYESLPMFTDVYLKIQKELFPSLDSRLLQKYLECIKNNSANGFDFQLPNDNISYKDLRTLLELNWLNDEVINFYLDLINKRSIYKNDTLLNYPLVHAFNTFFYEKLTRNGYNGVKRWTKKLYNKINIFEKRFILIPIHLAVHWCMCIVDNEKKTINYYDSLLTPNYDCIERIKDYLKEEHQTKYTKPINFDGWLFDCPTDIPKQNNGSDCGVFVCMFGEYSAREADFSFSQENMPYFRQKMIYEIFQNRLLL